MAAFVQAVVQCPRPALTLLHLLFNLRQLLASFCFEAMSGRMKLMKTLMKSRKKYKPPIVPHKFNIVRGDKVEVVGNHPERGKQGIVETVLRQKDRVIVQGVNLGPRKIKGNIQRGIPGGNIMVPKTIHYSKVNLVDPVTGKATRIYKKILEDGTKVRVAKKSGAIIPRPEILKLRRNARSSIVTESDTLDEDVWAITYDPSSSKTSETAESL